MSRPYPSNPVLHPRLSVLSTSSLPDAANSGSPTTSSPALSTRFSLPASGPSTTLVASSSASSLNVTTKGATGGGVRPNIYDRPLNKTRTTEVSMAAFSFLFSEMVQYTQKRVSGIADLERRLNTLGYRIGLRMHELMTYRLESTSRAPKRETRFLPALRAIGGPVWKTIFGKNADAIEKSVQHDDEFMIIDNEPPITKYISVPKDMSSLSCSALTAGIVEAILDGQGFPARVTAHAVPTDAYPQRTTILIKLDKVVIEREEALK